MQRPCVRIHPETNRPCMFPVGGGGNMHPEGHCPPPRGIRGEHRRLKLQKKRRAKRDGLDHVQRGAPVAGTGKPRGAGEKG